MKVLTRIATANDAQFIALLGRVTFSETFGHLFRDKQDLYNYYEETFAVKKIKNSLEKSNNIFWISYVDDLPVGYAKLKLNSPSVFLDSTNICQLQKLYVLKDFLSLKIGYQLQSQLLQKAKELKFDHAWLSVLDSNERAIQFYSRNNFEAVGRHDFQIGKESFNFRVMSKKLK